MTLSGAAVDVWVTGPGLRADTVRVSECATGHQYNRVEERRARTIPKGLGHAGYFKRATAGFPSSCFAQRLPRYAGMVSVCIHFLSLGKPLPELYVVLCEQAAETGEEIVMPRRRR